MTQITQHVNLLQMVRDGIKAGQPLASVLVTLDIDPEPRTISYWERVLGKADRKRKRRTYRRNGRPSKRTNYAVRVVTGAEMGQRRVAVSMAEQVSRVNEQPDEAPDYIPFDGSPQVGNDPDGYGLEAVA